LTALEEHSATFAVGAQTKAISLDALAAQWSGRYTLLWRLPRDVHDIIRPGERGPAVAWLSRQLAQVQGQVAEANKDPLFDDLLVRQVKQFQLARGLVPDGAVGPQTVIRLAGVGDQSAPKLLRQQGEK
jgi:general secretion pathway protein A